jgi:hypothetical protein
MSKRRSHQRFEPAQPWHGVLRILRDVIVQPGPGNDLTAYAQVAAVPGETLALDLLSAGARVTLRVTVRDCRPVVVDGAVRHKITLELADAPGMVPQAPDASQVAGLSQ